MSCRAAHLGANLICGYLSRGKDRTQGQAFKFAGAKSQEIL